MLADLRGLSGEEVMVADDTDDNGSDVDDRLQLAHLQGMAEYHRRMWRQFDEEARRAGNIDRAKEDA